MISGVFFVVFTSNITVISGLESPRDHLINVSDTVLKLKCKAYLQI